MSRPSRIHTLLKPLVFLACLAPFAALVWWGLAGDLGANPVETVTHHSGTWTLRLLMATLAVTPLRLVAGWGAVLRYRRMLGLFAFFYAVLHLAAYLWLDQHFAWRDIAEDILKRPYITVGFTAFLLLVPLAVTSTRGMVRRLGAQRWLALHRLVYISGLLGCLHFLWLVKADLREPVLYLAIFVMLMGLRTPVARRWLEHGRGARRRRATAP